MQRVERLETAAEGEDAGALRFRLYLNGEAAPLVAPAAAVLAERNVGLSDVKLGAPTLEDVFIHLTGRSLR